MKMLWVDHANYFGPCRRRKHGGLRVRERRHYNHAGPPPSLSIAMRQLRMRVLEAQGAGVAPFCERLRGVAHIARMHNEPSVSNALNTLAGTLAASRLDARNALYDALDQAHSVMRAA
jgi:hypothetical protein